MSGDVRKLFVVNSPIPLDNDMVVVLCDFCGDERYCCAENIKTARKRKMQVACLNCFIALTEKDGFNIGGVLSHGVVLKPGEENN
jgi:hypothetical protein